MATADFAWNGLMLQRESEKDKCEVEPDVRERHVRPSLCNFPETQKRQVHNWTNNAPSYITPKSFFNSSATIYRKPAYSTLKFQPQPTKLLSKMSPSTIQLTSAGLKDLDNDITEFSVDESSNLTKAAKDYLKVCMLDLDRVVVFTIFTDHAGSDQAYSRPHASWQQHLVFFAGSGGGCRYRTQVAARMEGEVEKRK